MRLWVMGICRWAALCVLTGALLVACGDGATTGLPDGGADVTTDTVAGDGGPQDASGDVAADAPGDALTDTVADLPDTPAPDVVPDGPAPDGVPGDAPLGDAPETADGCRPDECAIDDACWANLEGPEDNPCVVCLVVVDRLAWTPFDEGECDDEDACTDADHCADGECVGQALPCDDGEPCTLDTCDAETGVCSSVEAALPCEDGNPCTVGETCLAGTCQGGNPRSCDDGNDCTKDACVAGAGCVHQASDGAACEDGDTCTSGDTCSGKVCVPGNALSCDDGSLCTIDSCDGVGGCKHKSIADLCVDDNPCTTEGCDPKKGCVFPPNQDPCDDGSVCTDADTCAAGLCVGVPVLIDDGNPCTDDVCHKLLGVSHAPNTLPCDDGDLCTLGDLCTDSVCAPGGDTPDCDDENFCTDDACVPAEGCVNADNALPCDDASVCTLNDQCSAGGCAGVKISCDDSNPCTTDTCDPITGCKSTLIVSNACRPNIVVDYPPRAATLKAPPNFISVKGSVSSGAGPITSVKVNGSPALFSAQTGQFQLPIQTRFGGNTLVIEATDSFGSTRKVVQSFLMSNGYAQPKKGPPMADVATPGVGISFAQEVIDDGDHSLPPDDLATIFELVLDSFDLNALVPAGEPFDSLTIVFVDTDIYVNNFKDTGRKVSLISGVNGLAMTATISGLSAKVCTTPSGSSCSNTFAINGTLTASSIVIKGTVKLNVVNNQLVPKLEDVFVDVVGLNISIGVLVDWIINFFEPTLEAEVEAGFKDTLVGTLEPILADALGALAFNTSIDLPSLSPGGSSVPLDLLTDVHSAKTAAAGMKLELRAGAFGTQQISHTNLGAMKRLGCGSNFQQIYYPDTHAIELALADDTFNVLLYGAWQSGLLSFDVPAEFFADVDLSAFDISDLSISVDGLLQPTLSDCNPDSELLIHIGDLKVSGSMKVLGVSLNVEMYASLTAGVAFITDNGEVGLALTDIKSLETQVTVLQDNLIGSEALIADLINENLVPGLLGAIGGGALGGIPLPEIDLGGAVDGLPAGTVIAIDPQTNSRISGNTIIGGDLK